MRWILLVSSVLFVCCKQSSSEIGPHIISRSIEAHGGWEAYQRLDAIDFDKTTRLFDSQGNLESETRERQSFIFKPSYQTTIVQAMDSIVYDGVSLMKYVEDSILFDAEMIQHEVKRSIAAEYVFFQPFKLRDTTAVISLGAVKSLNSVDVSEVKVTYPNSEDSWWFYFDETNRCVANKVLHNGRTSLIENVAFQEYKGLLLHHHRKSYFLDSVGVKKYLRAEYLYEINR